LVGIIILHAVILILLAIPIFAVYSIIWIPPQVRIRSDMFFTWFQQPWKVGAFEFQNAMIIMVRVHKIAYNFNGFPLIVYSMIAPPVSSLGVISRSTSQSRQLEWPNAWFKFYFHLPTNHKWLHIHYCRMYVPRLSSFL
jgi:hypothetical protein